MVSFAYKILVFQKLQLLEMYVVYVWFLQESVS